MGTRQATQQIDSGKKPDFSNGLPSATAACQIVFKSSGTHPAANATIPMFRENAAGPGVPRQLRANGPARMVPAFRGVGADAKGAPHPYAHTRSTDCRTGWFRFAVAGDSVKVGPGDAFALPPHAEQGCIWQQPGTLIDSLAARRDEFL